MTYIVAMPVLFIMKEIMYIHNTVDVNFESDNEK